jgi:AraC-like DNA-binding protein
VISSLLLPPSSATVGLLSGRKGDALMKLDRASPDAALQDYVRYFEHREARVPGIAAVYPIVARPEQILEFYLQDRYRVRICESGAQDLAPTAVVVGPCSYRRADLVLRGRFDVFTIHFQASGFHRLFRVPMNDLADQAYEAQSIMGPIVLAIEQRLADASSFQERIRVATDFLLRHLGERASLDAVAAVANRFLLERGALRVDDAAASAGLSVRQFERRFAEQVGFPPKRYARIVRFSAALGAKMIAPGRLWTDIAHEFGYYDQMHMVRDFERFTGESPTRFVRRFQSLAEPWA